MIDLNLALGFGVAFAFALTLGIVFDLMPFATFGAMPTLGVQFILQRRDQMQYHYVLRSHLRQSPAHQDLLANVPERLALHESNLFGAKPTLTIVLF